MNRLMVFIDKYIYGIIAALTVYVAVFVYLQLETYTEYFPIESFYKGSRIDIPEDEIHLLKENLEIPADFQPTNVKSIAQDANDKRKKSYEDWAAAQSSGDPEKSVKDYEKELFQNQYYFSALLEVNIEAKNFLIKSMNPLSILSFSFAITSAI